MRVNSIQNSQRSEIVATSRKPNFQGKPANQAMNQLLPQKIIDHFGLNMNTAVKYKGAQSYTPAPETVGEQLVGYFHRLQVDWETHVDPKLPKEKY